MLKKEGLKDAYLSLFISLQPTKINMRAKGRTVQQFLYTV